MKAVKEAIDQEKEMVQKLVALDSVSCENAMKRAVKEELTKQQYPLANNF